MRVLITGATGFVGGHLIEALRRRGGAEVIGVGRGPFPAGTPAAVAATPLRLLDLSQTDAVAALLREARPDWVFHLAGYANAGKSFVEADAAWAGNLEASRSLYRAIAAWGGRPRVLITSSGLVYGDAVHADTVFREDDPLKPSSPYGASKASAEMLSYQVTRHPGLDVVRVRCFNQIGPRQTSDYAAANFARQVAAIRLGLQGPLMETGDLSGQRDITDVRDIVQAFVRLLEVGRSGEVYNAGSGRTLSMASVVERLVAVSGLEIEVRQRLDPTRKAEAAVSRADVSKIRAETGWEPLYSLEQTLRDMLEDWRQRLAAIPL